MKATIRVKSKSEAEAEEELRLKCRAREIVTTDRTDYETCLSLFKETCMKIRAATEYKEFRGGYDECVTLSLDPRYFNDSSIEALSRQMTALNSACNYEAGKLGSVSPDWWKECWKDELVEGMLER